LKKQKDDMNFKLVIFLVTIIPTIGNTQTKTYSNPVNKYKIDYLEDWLLKEENGRVTLYAPLESQTDNEYENLGINISTASGMTLEQCYKTYVTDGLPPAFKEFQKVEEGNWDINGHKAKWIEYKFKDGPKSITNLTCILVKNNKLFMLIGYSSTKKYSNHKDKFITMIKSFKLG
jgi:hypothetical protein